MSEMDLVTAAKLFSECYHAAKKLCGEQVGWDCVITLTANDDPQHVTLMVKNGVIETISVGEGHSDLTVTASLAILLDILQFRLHPNQPYLFGELTITGREEDFMRVDYIVTMLYDR